MIFYRSSQDFSPDDEGNKENWEGGAKGVDIPSILETLDRDMEVEDAKTNQSPSSDEKEDHAPQLPPKQILPPEDIG